ncbi:hypothetical protein J6590_067903 [Homalodisca vitripennis]|nr:hypothetical protein J6590_067903 [Homalodisca vitripennis]
MWGGAVTLLGLAFVQSASGAVVLLTLCMGSGAGIFTGYLTNLLDLSPNHAGLLMGIINGIGSISAILGPMATGFIIQDETSREQWMSAFYVCAATLFLGNLVFLIFSTAVVQPWNDPLKSEEQNTLNALKNLRSQDLEKTS